MNINSSLQKTPIAVIGLSTIVADARNIEEFWTNIIQGKDSITDVPKSRWDIDDYYDADMTAPDKTYCKRGGFIPDINFNPMEFGLPPNILEVTDASQLLGLIAARDALKDAGYGKDSVKFTTALKAKTGVLLGVGGGQKLITPLISRLQYPIWEKALRESGIAEADIAPIIDKMKKAYVGWNENSFPGLLGNVISGRITNRFDLGGINSVVDAACAASLSAIKMSLSELVEGRCDMMLTGGVDTDNSPFMYMSFSKTPAFSKSGNISPFGDKADGMLIGEGLGMLVLKRLEDAERDGDRIYATITGVGTSSDGRFKSVYAPRPAGQAMAVERAYEDAGYAPSTVGLIEAHGTGTAAGDPVEFSSMQMVFGKDNPKKQHIALGSIKSQVGHTKAAAGAVGMVKAVLGLHHKVLPPTINVEKPNSKFDIKNSAIYINTEARPWLRNGHPRRAGISAFGFGGINVHIALEEYAGNKPKDYRIHEPYKTVLLSEQNPNQLLETCKNTLANLEGEESKLAFLNLTKASKNSIANPSFARLGFVATDIEECISLLQTSIQMLQTKQEQWNHPKGIYYRPNGIDANSKNVVALFAGQGSQYVGMGKELTNAFPELNEAFQQTDKLFEQSGETALSKTIFPIPVFTKEERTAQQKTLTQTKFAQPAIGTLSMGQYKILQNAGFKPSFTAGHSFGELTALWAGGVYNENTFLALAKTRGAVMSIENPNADKGSMLAVEASQEQVQQAITNIPGVSIANVNSNSQIILGGSTQAISNAEQQLKNQGYTVIPLPVSAAFHTDFVKHAQEPFARFIAVQQFNKPHTPVYSNTSGLQFPEDSNAIKAILEGQILKPVLFKNQIENIYNAGGRVFVEFGPKGVLTKLVGNILQGKEHTAIAINPNAKKDSDLQFRQAIVQLHVLGLQLSNVDPYLKEAEAPAKATKMDVIISGANYVSPATRKAYTDVMSDGFKISGNQTQVIEKIVEVEKIIEVEAKTTTQPANENTGVSEVLLSTLESFKANQTKSLELFERFINEQNSQSNQLLDIIGQQVNGGQANITTPTTSSPIIETPTPVQIKTEEAPQSNNTSIDTSQLEKMLLEVVSEKTGYPAEMLEMNMDMEADLGIDSIKRVEIFGALTKQYPSMAGINPSELTELRTLGEIVTYVAPKDTVMAATSTTVANNAAPAAATPVNESLAPVQAVVEETPQASNSNVDTSQLEKMLLEVVSEKTGYPAEMLEMNMDMEADLGIDSIKRVEIFGALTKQYPSMAGINPSELTELRTLGEIVTYVAPKGAATVANNAAPTTAAPVHKAPAPVQAEVQAVTEETPQANNTDTTQLEKMLLEVVSEKTGYPAEMLEMNMDMEADLGIDSIKRVEIFGALTKQYPSMAGINPSELTELRTLGEIVTYVAHKGAATVANNAATTTAAPVIETPAPVQAVIEETPQASSNIDTTQLEKMLLEVVSEKTGYPAEMLEMNMDMEADLGIDSIKRVEIFGALTKQYPSMDGINPSELTELRTLGEIVTYVAPKGAATPTNAATVANEVNTATAAPVIETAAPVQAVIEETPQTNNSNVDTSQLEKMLLEVVSEKTGYPAEMLEMNMDMEADLGIDSIKRVEIFGALTKQYPSMAGINPSELTELRTLGEIVTYVGPKGTAVIANATAVANEVVNTTAAPVNETPATVQAVVEETVQASHSKVDTSQLEKMLLEVVSEKTGYPAEMLELNMDMEADLGIDSIKRVEIFGALTKQYPSMAGINPSELTELRTLGEIVTYVAPKGATTPTTATAVANEIVNTTTAPVNETAASVQAVIEVEVQVNDSNVDTTQLEKMLLEVVSEKTGYPAEMLELNMDMEADLGIDSIKRVEIFGALTKQYPDMSDINSSELTELRTLGEIVDYVSTSTKKKNPSNSVKPLANKNKEYITTGEFHKVERNNIGLKYLPQADFMEFSLPDTHLTLVTNEGSDLTPSVVNQLGIQGHQVIVLNLPGTTSTHPTHVNLSAHTDEAIKTAIEEVHNKYGKIGTFIHLHPHYEFQNGNFTQHFKADKEAVKTVFFLAKHLQQDLNDLGQTQRANFVTVSRMDGMLGQGNRGNVSVIGGGLPGLVKCLNLEWSSVYCRAVDIQPELSLEKISSQVIAELHDANKAIIEVAFSEEGRKTTSVTPDIVPEKQKIKTTITKDSVFLVSGGAKGVTASCVVEMAKAFQCKFILLGRSNFNIEIPDYAQNGVDDSTLKRSIMNDLKEKSKKPSLPIVQSIFGDIVAKKEIDNTIAQIEKYGGQVVYLKGDVNNLKASQAELNKITAQLGEITGIIHGAGRLADKYIQDKTEEDFENVISVKLNGLLSLLSVVDIDKLDHLVMFSSVAGFYGNLGQSDYAIANEILSKAAHLFKTNHPNTHVTAINWGAWDSGMVSDELKVMFKAAGIKLVNSTGGAAMMVNEFNTDYANQPQVIIGGTLPEAVSHHQGNLRNYRIKRNLKLANNPFLNHHVIQGNAVLPVVNAVGWMSQACERIYPDFKVFQITDTKLFKGIVFDGKQVEDYVIELKEVEKSAEKIVFEATILSEGKKLPTYHYKTGVMLMHKNKIPQAPNFTPNISGTYQTTDGAVLYKDGSLFHDKYFQGIEKIIDWNEKQIILSCKAPEVPLSEQGQFAIQSINTFFADIQYQGMVVWVQKYLDGAMSLPLQTNTATLYKPVPFGKELMVNVSIQEASEFKMVAKCTVYDAEGTVYMQTDGAAVTVSKQLVW